MQDAPEECLRWAREDAPECLALGAQRWDPGSWAESMLDDSVAASSSGGDGAGFGRSVAVHEQLASVPPDWEDMEDPSIPAWLLSEWVQKKPLDGPIGTEPITLNPGLCVAPELAQRIAARRRNAIAAPRILVKGGRSSARRKLGVKFRDPVVSDYQDPPGLLPLPTQSHCAASSAWTSKFEIEQCRGAGEGFSRSDHSWWQGAFQEATERVSWTGGQASDAPTVTWASQTPCSGWSSLSEWGVAGDGHWCQAAQDSCASWWQSQSSPWQAASSWSDPWQASWRAASVAGNDSSAGHQSARDCDLQGQSGGSEPPSRRAVLHELAASDGGRRPATWSSGGCGDWEHAHLAGNRERVLESSLGRRAPSPPVRRRAEQRSSAACDDSSLDWESGSDRDRWSWQASWRASDITGDDGSSRERRRPKAHDHSLTVPKPKHGWSHPGGQSISQLEVGMDVEGRVTNITNAGAFVAFGAQKDGLLSAAACRARGWDRDLRVGDEITGLVVGIIDTQRNRVTLHFAGGASKGDKAGKGKALKGEGKRNANNGELNPGKAAARAALRVGDAVVGAVTAVTMRGASVDVNASTDAWLPDGAGAADVRKLRVGDRLDLVVDGVDRRSDCPTLRVADDTAAWKATCGAFASTWMEDGTGGTFGRDERD